jgi:L-lactate utilization protein LutC
MDPAVVASLFSLAGVVLGAAGTMLGQHIAMRTTRTEAQAARTLAYRAERKAAILEFLEVTQHVERIVAKVHAEHKSRDHDEATRVTDQLWLKQKQLELIASKPLCIATFEFTERLNAAVWQDLPDGTNCWDYMNERRALFLAAARADVDVPGK